MIVILALIGAVLAALWIVSMLSVLTNPDRYRNGTQLIWVLVLLLGGPAGIAFYQCLGPVRGRAPKERAVPDRRHRVDAIAHPWSEADSS
ncbi:MAG: hypothetical protein ACRDY0_12995 [Acidimicrobiales bacterium]